MKNFEDLTYYEMLELPVNATHFEIRQAYKDALSTYDEDSMVTYSLFTDDARANILKKIEEAFHALIDSKSRAEYDSKLVEDGRIDPTLLSKKDEKKPIPLFRTRSAIDEVAFSKRIKSRINAEEVKKISEQILSKDIINGKDLKNLRKSMAIEINEIFEISKISVSILNSIENDDIESLPPTVYLKNFLKIYAELLLIDPNKIVKGYLNNISLHNGRD